MDDVWTEKELKRKLKKAQRDRRDFLKKFDSADPTSICDLGWYSGYSDAIRDLVYTIEVDMKNKRKKKK